MADIASETALQHIESLYPHGEITSSLDVIKTPWYLPTLASFTAGNRPEAVPLLFKYVLGGLEQAQNRFNTPVLEANHEKYLLAHRFRDAIFKGAIIGGFSRAINALVSLLEVTPEELLDTNRQRDTTLSLPELEKRGQAFFKANYGETGDDVQSLLDRIYPDMGWFCNTIGYGSVYGYTEILDQLETSYVLVGSLIAADTPRQIGWHLENARRGGASLEQIRAVRQIAICASQSAGVRWRNVIPEIKE